MSNGPANAGRERPASYPRQFPRQQQEPPGSTRAMEPTPDHGEDSYRGSGRLEGMRALITGGDSGIGRAVAIAFAREGAAVTITHLPEEADDAADTVAAVDGSGSGRGCLTIEADLTERDTCRQVVERTIAGLGGLDILVNNAGYQMARTESIEDVTPEQLDRVMRTNLYALFWLTQAVVPHLQPGSCIINNSSIQAYQPSTSLLDYAATKSAINNFTVNLAAELGPRGIRVNAVAPGPIWTPLQPATQPVGKVESFGQDTPLGRAGQPAEVAPAFVFLASPADASYVSASILGVTGGKPTF